MDLCEVYKMKNFMYKTWLEPVILVGTGAIFLICALGTNFSDDLREGFKDASFWFTIGTIIFSLIVCGLYWVKMKRNIDKNKFDDNFYPTLMVAQGTYYTFIGISAVLITCGSATVANHSVIDVKELLAGLRLAFLTSVIGLISSIGAKIYMKKRSAEFQRECPNQQEILVEDEQIYHALIDIKNVIEKQETALKEVHKYSIDKSQEVIINSVEKLTNSIGQCIEDKINKALEENVKVINELMTKNVNCCIEEIKSCHNQYIDSFEEYRNALNVAVTAIRAESEYAGKVNMQLQQGMEVLEKSVNVSESAMDNIMHKLEGVEIQHRKAAEYFGAILDQFKKNDLINVIAAINKTTLQVEEGVADTAERLVGYSQIMNDLLKELHNSSEQMLFIRTKLECHEGELSNYVKKMNDYHIAVLQNLNNKNNEYYSRLLAAQKKFEENLNMLAKDFSNVVSEEYQKCKELDGRIGILENKIR